MSGPRPARWGPVTVAATAATVIATSAIMLSGCVAGADTTPTSTDARSVSVPAADDPDLVDWAAIVTELDRRRAAAQRDPSMEAIDSFCAPMSECNEQWSDSIGYLIDNDLRMVGGHPDEIVDVVYAGTLDGSPLSEAFEVVLDLERRAVEQGVIQLVTDDGSVEQEFRPDEEAPPGSTVFEALVLQRRTLTSEWLVFETG